MNNIPELTQNPIILAIDTSCDETSVAILRGTEILANAIYSQMDLHKEYGGVVPGLAKLEHEKKFDGVLQDALKTAGIKLPDVQAIAVTKGPGLAIALEVGIRKAKELAKELKVPLFAINHMAGHLFSALGQAEPSFPVVGLLVSGKHTEFLLVKDLDDIRKLGQTVDDACGEAYDKFATMLGLGYPGGPVVSKLAAESRDLLRIETKQIQQTTYVIGYDPETTTEKYRLPLPMSGSGDLNTSYSGLKTAIKQIINNLSGVSIKTDIKQTGRSEQLSKEQIGELCVMFEAAALGILILKLEQAMDQYNPQEIWLGGGVASSPRLQALCREICHSRDMTFRVAVDRGLLTDNAAMIGLVLGLLISNRKLSLPGNIIEAYSADDLENLDRNPNWSL